MWSLKKKGGEKRRRRRRGGWREARRRRDRPDDRKDTPSGTTGVHEDGGSAGGGGALDPYAPSDVVRTFGVSIRPPARPRTTETGGGRGGGFPEPASPGATRNARPSHRRRKVRPDTPASDHAAHSRRRALIRAASTRWRSHRSADYRSTFNAVSTSSLTCAERGRRSPC